MRHCKKCGIDLSDDQADKSIDVLKKYFRQTNARCKWSGYHIKKVALAVGPLCDKCLEKRI
jgi:predicted Zn-ribbon and HTH transcriptional regulator